MHYFATNLKPGQQTTHSLRASQYRHSFKRKRDEDSDEGPDSLEDDAKGLPASSNAQSYIPSDPLESTQLRVAGLLPDDVNGVPPPPFPHAFPRAPNDYFSGAKVQQEIANLDPAVYAVDTKSKSDPVSTKSERPALRRTHLDILSTVMHRCLLEGDYDRAARAWGMVLRTQIAGQPIDPRNHGRWGIGAELLLRRKPGSQSGHIRHDDYAQSDSGQITDNENEIYAEGFELARAYYERLIVQYPNRKVKPHAVDDRTFYPALFSVWIKEVTAKSSRARKQYQTKIDQLASSSVSSDSNAGKENLALESAIHAEELAGARLINERLDQLIMSPPFDKHRLLLELRENVKLWIADLERGGETSRGSDAE